MGLSSSGWYREVCTCGYISTWLLLTPQAVAAGNIPTLSTIYALYTDLEFLACFRLHEAWMSISETPRPPLNHISGTCEPPRLQVLYVAIPVLSRMRKKVRIMSDMLITQIITQTTTQLCVIILEVGNPNNATHVCTGSRRNHLIQPTYFCNLQTLVKSYLVSILVLRVKLF